MKSHDKMLGLPLDVIRGNFLIGIIPVIMTFRIFSNYFSHKIHCCNGSIVAKITLITLDDVRSLFPERIEDREICNIVEEIVDPGKLIEKHCGEGGIEIHAILDILGA